jgi:PIN domain nuclease of toxin-antitoxin system
MRLLLDTHIFLWAASNDKRLTKEARSTIRSAQKVYVSAASIWEISIKAALGKIDADPAELIAAIDGAGFVSLPVRVEHAARVKSLALHHADPFDRMLVAQAMQEPLHLLTADRLLIAYSPLVLLV